MGGQEGELERGRYDLTSRGEGASYLMSLTHAQAPGPMFCNSPTLQY